MATTNLTEKSQSDIPKSESILWRILGAFWGILIVLLIVLVILSQIPKMRSPNPGNIFYSPALEPAPVYILKEMNRKCEPVQVTFTEKRLRALTIEEAQQQIYQCESLATEVGRRDSVEKCARATKVYTPQQIHDLPIAAIGKLFSQCYADDLKLEKEDQIQEMIKRK